ncbi:hypothetical protein RJT34_04561 [Clitoria ternatea]|uniref:Uncharacterized protein n=1 Tax=Clitoria ternatea TaxID=43366 RepID=A0AAN9Q6A1_CLITE
MLWWRLTYGGWREVVTCCGSSECYGEEFLEGRCYGEIKDKGMNEDENKVREAYVEEVMTNERDVFVKGVISEVRKVRDESVGVDVGQVAKEWIKRNKKGNRKRKKLDEGKGKKKEND